MRNGFAKKAFAVIATAMLASCIGWGAASGAPGGGHELVGTWRVTVQLHDCATGRGIGGPFPSLLTFNDGETMIEDTTNPSFAVGQRGTGHGIWEYRGGHTYAVKSVAFINFTTLPPPPPGFKAGTQTISQTIEFNDGSDTWAADAQIQFADTNGTIYRQGCATASAQRFELKMGETLVSVPKKRFGLQANPK